MTEPNVGWSEFDPEAGEPGYTPVESVTVFGVAVKPGDRVRLWPQSNSTRSADILDLALKGKIAIIEAIERDLDDHLHLAVVIEDDPGRDLGMLRQPGHRFFFSPDEIEPLSSNPASLEPAALESPSLDPTQLDGEVKHDL